MNATGKTTSILTPMMKQFISQAKMAVIISVTIAGFAGIMGNTAFAAPYDTLKSDFTNLPLNKRLTMPLFWQHGESTALLLDYVDRIKDGGNGSFIIEPRPHPDWLGPRWWSDFSATLDYAQTKGMGGYMYDEGFEWQSFNVGGKVPQEHRFKYLRSSSIDVTGPTVYNGSDHGGAMYIKTLAGKFTGNGGNLALGKTIRASTVEVRETGYEAAKANDGDDTSRWNAHADSATNQWLEIDFGSATTFNNLIIQESYDRIQSYAIQYWNGSSWVSCDSGTSIGSSKIVQFDAVTGSKVRLFIHVASMCPTINEFKVYNDPPGGSGIDASSLIDLTPNITNGNLSWTVPAGTWKIMKFTYETATDYRQCDLASQDAIDWWLDYVIKPHFDHARPGQILGSFYDEPYFFGTWGKGMENDSPRWKEMMTSRFYPLCGEDQHKATYEYWETLGERMSKVGNGSYRDYLHARGAILIGHDNEDDRDPAGGYYPLDFGGGPLNIMEKEKYQDMPGFDLVCDQLYTRQERKMIYQLPKLISSIAIGNDLSNHYAMCEIFGAYSHLTWADRQWLADWCQVHGANVLVPHAFNPKGSVANPDEDCPPFYYYTGDEANWPKYKSWCERQNRLSHMLTGNDSNNYSVAPVAMLWPGYSKYVDDSWNNDNCYPYTMQTALDRAHYDHQLLTYNRFEGTATLNAATKQIELYESKYKILILPPVQNIQYATMEKVKQFYDNGGVVIGWQRTPPKSAKFGNPDSAIQSLSIALWNSLTPSTSVTPIKSNANGGKTYFIASTDENTITTNLRNILSNSGINSDFKVTSGTFDKWTGCNHRKRNGMDVFMVWNGAASAATITARFQATGDPELWNPTTMAMTSPAFTRVSSNEVDIALNIPAEESYLVVFKPPVVATKP